MATSKTILYSFDQRFWATVLRFPLTAMRILPHTLLQSALSLLFIRDRPLNKCRQ